MTNNYNTLSDYELISLYKEKKKQAVQLHNNQMAIKILMNSLYGAAANRYFIYYIPEMAEAITTSGQLSIRYAAKTVNEYLNKVLKTKDNDYVIYCDTDSVFVDLSSLIEMVAGTTNVSKDKAEKLIDKISKEKIEPVISKGYEELAETLGAYRNAMEMKREKIANKAVFIAKKRYIASVINEEGVHFETPKIAVTGVEAVRSSTPQICREKLKESFRVMLSETEEKTQEFIKEFKKEFVKLPVEEVAKISGTDDISKYEDKQFLYKKGCPMHVRGCIIYNNYLKQKGLDKKYPLISSGDKIKFVYLKVPNPVLENIISFPGVLPKEMELEKYIDYETQFEKVFLSPLETITESIGWTTEKVDTIEDFFS